MTCSVNLVPKARLHTRTRARRRLVWVATCATFAVLLTTGWGIERTASDALTRLSESVGVLDVQRSEAQRRLVLATARRTRLMEQLRALAMARRPQPWARRLVTLTREAPEGVFLTSIQIGAPVSEYEAPANAKPAPAGSPARVDPQTAAAAEFQTVRLLGYALDHGALLQFLNMLQGLPATAGWRQVELVRASQEPFRTGQAIAFELECRTAGETPPPPRETGP